MFCDNYGEKGINRHGSNGGDQSRDHRGHKVAEDSILKSRNSQLVKPHPKEVISDPFKSDGTVPHRILSISNTWM